jgi:hypothetical protein
MKTNYISTIYLLIVVLLVGLLRIFQPMINFTPLGAVFLFGGSLFHKNKTNAWVPLLSLFITDMIIQGIILKGQYGFPLYSGWLYVYITFVLTSVIGYYMFQKHTIFNIYTTAFITTFIHWLVTNFGVWISAINPLYTKDWSGLVLCYTAALPFELSLLASTFLYTVILTWLYKVYVKTVFKIQWND